MATLGGSGDGDGDKNPNRNNNDKFTDKFFQPKKTKSKSKRKRKRNSKLNPRKRKLYGDSYQPPKEMHRLSQYGFQPAVNDNHNNGEPQTKRQRYIIPETQIQSNEEDSQLQDDNDDDNDEDVDLEQAQSPHSMIPETQFENYQHLCQNDDKNENDDADIDSNSDDDVLNSNAEQDLERIATPNVTETVTNNSRANSKRKSVARPRRRHWCVTIPDIKLQLQKMNIKPELFENNIEMFDDMINALLPRGNGGSRRNIERHILVYEGVRDDIESEQKSNWHAHGLFTYDNDYRVMNRQPGLSIARGLIHNWICDQMEDEAKNQDADADADSDNNNWSYKIDDEAGEYIEESHTHLRINICDDWLGQYEGYIYYMFKTYGYSVNAMRIAKHCIYGGYEDDVEIQKIIEKVIRQKAGNNRRNAGIMRRMTEPLTKIHDLDVFNRTVERLKIDHADTLMQYWRNFNKIVNIHKSRIVRELRDKRQADSRALPALKRDWKIEDFRFGSRILRQSEVIRKQIMLWYPKAYQNIVGFIQDNIINGIKTKNNCLILKFRNYGSGKTLWIHILHQKFNMYELKVDKGWNGAAYDEGVQILYIDSATSDHFSVLGILPHQLESMAGKVPATMSVRAKNPVMTKGQPIVMTIQPSFKDLGYLREPHTRNMLRARSTYITSSAQNWKEHSLLPLCYHMMKVWNIKNPFGGESKTKAELGRYNVIGSDSEIDNEWNDEDEPGKFQNPDDEKDDSHPDDILIDPKHKIVNRNLIYYPGIEEDPYWDDDIDIEFENNHNHNAGDRASTVPLSQDTEDVDQEQLICENGLRCPIAGGQHWNDYLHVPDVADENNISQGIGIIPGPIDDDENDDYQDRLATIRIECQNFLFHCKISATSLGRKKTIASSNIKAALDLFEIKQKWKEFTSLFSDRLIQLKMQNLTMQ